MARKKRSSPRCRYCKTPITFIPETFTWYCSKCDMHQLIKAPKPGYKRVTMDEFFRALDDSLRGNPHLDHLVPPGHDPIDGNKLPIRKRMVLIVPGKAPSVCPRAQPQIPETYLPTIVARWRSLNLLPDGDTVHWVGEQARLDEICDCFRLSGKGELPQEDHRAANPNESRDKYCYEQMMDGKTRAWIKNHVKPAWYSIDSEQGISEAAKRYAKRHRLPWPIPR